MKLIHTKRELKFILFSALFLSLVGCGKSYHDTTEDYVLVADNVKLPYWQEAAAGMKAAAGQLEVRYEVVGPEKHDPKAQHEEFQRLLARKVPPVGILVSASDPELMKGDIDAAIGQGIPVIAIDSDAASSKRLFFIGTENYAIGLMGGQLTAKLMQGKGNVVVLTMPGQANLAQRLRGYQEAFANHPGIKIVQVVDMKGDAAVAFDTVKDIVTNGKVKPDAFVCLEAIGGAEVAEVLDRNQVKDKIVIAMDTDQTTLEGVKKGAISATIAQKPFSMAFVGVKMLDDLYHHKPQSLLTNWAQDRSAPIPSFVDTGSTLITKDNVATFQSAASAAPEKK